MATKRPSVQHFRIGELAKRSGVSIATVKYYIREGVLPSPPVKTGRTMGYYDAAYLDRLILVRRLRDEHFLPIRVIRVLLQHEPAEALRPDDATLARLSSAVARGLKDLGRGKSPRKKPQTWSARALRGEYRLTAEQLALLTQMGVLGERKGRRVTYSRADIDILEAMRGVRAAGLTLERIPIENLGHYVELIGELARREVDVFVRHGGELSDREAPIVAERGVRAFEAFIIHLRRKLIYRAAREELQKRKRH